MCFKGFGEQPVTSTWNTAVENLKEKTGQSITSCITIGYSQNMVYILKIDSIKRTTQNYSFQYNTASAYNFSR